MTYLDYFFIGVILLYVLLGLKRGLIKTLYSFFSLILGILITYYLYPFISEIIFKYTKVYFGVSEKVVQALQLEELAKNKVSPQDQLEMMNQLKIPEALKVFLKENRNSEMFEILKATKIEEYIGGTIAAIAINALVFVLVFVFVMFVLKIITHVFDIISMLPILHQLNKLGGGFLGLVQGILVSWIICIFFSMAFTFEKWHELFEYLELSPVASVLYNNNFLMKLVLNLQQLFVIN